VEGLVGSIVPVVALGDLVGILVGMSATHQNFIYNHKNRPAD
jgi:hypothetical protein